MKNLDATFLRKLGIIAALVFCLGVNIYLRLDKFHFAYLYASSKEDLYKKIKDNLEEKVALAYPDIWGSAKDRVLSCAFDAYLQENATGVSREIEKNVEEAKSFYLDEHGWPYLLEVDSYRWMRRISTYLDTGHFGTSFINGKEYDDFDNAPLGREIEPLKLHYYLGSYFYKIVHFFNPRLSLMNVLSLFTFLITPLIILCVWVLSRLLGLSWPASFLAGITTGLSAPVLEHSLSGWFDTDGYNIMFPTLILILLTSALRNYRRRRYFYLCLAGVAIGAYSGCWSVWWLTFYVSCVGLALYLIEAIIRDKKGPLVKRVIRYCPDLFIFLGVSYTCVICISGVEVFKKSFSDPLSMAFLRSSVFLDKFWPNISAFIGELGRPNFQEIVHKLGGPVILFGAAFGLLGLYISKSYSWRYPQRRFLIYSLAVWLITAGVLVFFGRKFILFLALPVGIFFGKAWDWLVLISDQAPKKAVWFLGWVNKNRKKIFLAPVFLYLTFINIQNAQNIRLIEPPIFMNRGLLRMLNNIEKLTPSNAIILSRWDLGDYVMCFGKRATFASASVPITPLAYWLPRALMTGNEKEAVGILRMLSAGSTMAFNELSGFLGQDKLKAMDLLKAMLLMDREQANRLLSQYLSNRFQVEKVLALIYDAKRPVYVLLEKDLFIDFALIQDSEIASWDFRKAGIWNLFAQHHGGDLSRIAQEQLGHSKKETEKQILLMQLLDINNVVKWIIKPMGYIYLPLVEQSKINAGGDRVFFDNAITVDLKSMKFYVYNTSLKIWVTPGYVISCDGSNNSVKEYINPNGEPELAVFLLRQDSGKYKALILSRNFAQSILFKMFFLKGYGLNNFKLLHYEHTQKWEDKDMYLYAVKMD
jgi:dolichyl-phosphooligosaccharide-protein glycotransferase